MALQEHKFKVIGTRPIRHDGVDKVTGRAKYGADIYLPGMLHAHVLRSPHAHARITSLDASAAVALPGVKAVITSQDLPDLAPGAQAMGEMTINPRYLSMNILAKDKVLYNKLLTHYSINKATDVLGKTYDYQIIYEHSALAAYHADSTKSYRYVKLPNDISLSDPSENFFYRQASIRIPGLRSPSAAPTVRIPGTRVIWGLTVLKTAPHLENAVKFLQLLFSSQGSAVQTRTGPTPTSPPLVSRRDHRHLPSVLRSLVDVSH